MEGALWGIYFVLTILVWGVWRIGNKLDNSNKK